MSLSKIYSDRGVISSHRCGHTDQIKFANTEDASFCDPYKTENCRSTEILIANNTLLRKYRVKQRQRRRLGTKRQITEEDTSFSRLNGMPWTISWACPKVRLMKAPPSPSFDLSDAVGIHCFTHSVNHHPNQVGHPTKNFLWPTWPRLSLQRPCIADILGWGLILGQIFLIRSQNATVEPSPLAWTFTSSTGT